MSAIKLRIHSRQREHMGVIASLDDFEWSEGDAVEAATLLSNSNITLYCLDHARERAIFTALPNEIDLSQLPFMYLIFTRKSGHGFSLNGTQLELHRTEIAQCGMPATAIVPDFDVSE